MLGSVLVGFGVKPQPNRKLLEKPKTLVFGKTKTIRFFGFRFSVFSSVFGSVFGFLIGFQFLIGFWFSVFGFWLLKTKNFRFVITLIISNITQNVILVT